MADIPKDIVTRAAGGDRLAFEEIYRLTSGFVYSVAFRIAGNKDDAEEVTQDVFMQIYRNLNSFEFRSSFKTWAYRITVNTAINKYRQAAREKIRRHEYEAETVKSGVSDKPLEFIEKEISEQRITSLLRELDSDQRVCIVLREIEGLSYKEMAEVLKININTVRSRLKRAREALIQNSSKGEISHEVR